MKTGRIKFELEIVNGRSVPYFPTDHAPPQGPFGVKRDERDGDLEIDSHGQMHGRHDNPVFSRSAR
jgi:hypothetical protein